MNILLTGSSGSIGSEMVPYLTAQGHLVTRLGSDIRDPLALQHEVSKLVFTYDWVVHMAAIVTSVPAELAGPNTFDVNVTGTFNVASMARELGSRFCYFSTTVIYKPGESPYSEKSVPRPETLYAHTKWLGEQTARFVYRDQLEKLLIIRPAFTYGSPNDHSLISNLIKNAAHNEYSIVRMSPGYFKTYTHTKDFCWAIERLLIGKKSGDFNVSSSMETTLTDILSEIKKLGITPRIYPRPELDYLKDHVIDNSKLLKELPEWKPKVTLGFGISQIAHKILCK